jgi:hypothetical protein
MTKIYIKIKEAGKVKNNSSREKNPEVRYFDFFYNSSTFRTLST